MNLLERISSIVLGFGYLLCYDKDGKSRLETKRKFEERKDLIKYIRNDLKGRKKMKGKKTTLGFDNEVDAFLHGNISSVINKELERRRAEDNKYQEKLDLMLNNLELRKIRLRAVCDNSKEFFEMYDSIVELIKDIKQHNGERYNE